MDDLTDTDVLIVHELTEIAELLGNGEWPGLAEWQRLAYLPPPKINGNHIWRP